LSQLEQQIGQEKQNATTLNSNCDRHLAQQLEWQQQKTSETQLSHR